MAAKRLGRTMIDWVAFAERVPPDQRAMFVAFKTRSDSYLRRVNEYPEAPPKIDWSFYRSHIAVPGLVDEFEKSFKALNIPYPKENVMAEIDTQEKEAEKQREIYVKKSNENITNYQKELDSLKALIPFDQMTMEDFRDAFPHLALDPINRPTFWPHEPEEEDSIPAPSAEVVKPQVATA